MDQGIVLKVIMMNNSINAYKKKIIITSIIILSVVFTVINLSFYYFNNFVILIDTFQLFTNAIFFALIYFGNAYTLKTRLGVDIETAEQAYQDFISPVQL